VAVIGLAGVPGHMADSVFDRETLLDISVNIIPLVIIAFFLVVLFLAQFPPDPFAMVISVGLHVIPFVGLTILTYIAAHYI